MPNNILHTLEDSRKVHREIHLRRSRKVHREHAWSGGWSATVSSPLCSGILRVKPRGTLRIHIANWHGCSQAGIWTILRVCPESLTTMAIVPRIPPAWRHAWEAASTWTRTAIQRSGVTAARQGAQISARASLRPAGPRHPQEKGHRGSLPELGSRRPTSPTSFTGFTQPPDQSTQNTSQHDGY